MNFRRTIGLAVLISMVIPYAKAQSYMLAAGYRSGNSNALTVKSFLNREDAFELMWTFRNEGMQWTLLYENHTPALTDRTDGFYWYYGFGPHLGFNKAYVCDDDCPIIDTVFDGTSAYFVTEVPDERTSLFAMGVNFMIGLEYRFIALPITVGLEYKPMIEFFYRERFESSLGDIGLSLKYTFNRFQKP